LAANPSASLVLRAVLRGAAWFALALSSYWALRLAWADQLSTATELADRQRAVQLAPIPIFAERLATRREELGGDGLPDLLRAAALDPENPDRLMRLGLRAEMAGDYPLAEKSLLAAAARSRLYQPKYLLAQYFFRRQDADRFWPWARQSLEAAYGDAAPLFELCWRQRPDAAWLRANAIPPRRELARQYLAYLTSREQWTAASVEAHRLAGSAEQADLPGLLAYCDACLSRSDVHEAAEIWNALCNRRLLPHHPLDPAGENLVTNGDFLRAPSGRGFDWRLVAVTGVSADAVGGALRISLSGRQPERSPVIWQYVLTVPGTRYLLRYEAHTGTAVPAPGITWEVTNADPQGESEYSLQFVATKSLTQVMLVYRRPPGSARLEGAVSITRVRLERAP
jgi:tetratricopeptide (TPR) repeat protein